jgi:hypothetical protein
VSAWLACLTSLLAPTHDGNGQLMVYHAGDSDQPLSCDIVPYRRAGLNQVPFGGKFLFLRSTGEESSYLPRPTRTLRMGLGVCLGVRLHSPKCIGHVPTSRFRVERLPRGPEGLRLTWRYQVRGISSGLPRAEPLLAPIGYEFPIVFGFAWSKRPDEFAFPFFGFTG